MEKQHEVALNTREENGDSITEILAFLNDGKVYQGNPNEQRQQKPQKGGLCWYYALNRIRTRYGKEVSEQNENRRIEKIISNYRKELSKIDLLEETTKVIISFYPTIPLSVTNKNMFSDNTFLNDRADAEPAFQAYYEIIFRIRTFLDSSQLNLSEASIAEKNDFFEKLAEIAFDGIPVLKKIELKSSYSYFEIINVLTEALISANQNEPYAQEKLRRVSILIIELLCKIISLSSCSDDLSVEQAIQFVIQFNRFTAVKKLYEDLKLEVNPAFFEKNLTFDTPDKKIAQEPKEPLHMSEEIGEMTTEVARLRQEIEEISEKIKQQHAELMRLGKAREQEAERRAKMIYQIIASEPLVAYSCCLDSSGKITQKSAGQAAEFFRYAHTYAYSVIIDLYNLNKTSWTPKDGFTALTKTINENGVLISQGYVGLPYYKKPPSQIAMSKIGSRTIRFWAPEDLKPIEKDEPCHVINVIGTQQITHQDTQQEYVLFLDPNDTSSPGQEREVYRMNYADFEHRVTAYRRGNVRDVDELTPNDESVYAVSAKNIRC